MIEKMEFISITGHKEDLDRVINTYISKYDIQLEDALNEFKNINGLEPYNENNPYNNLYTITKSLKDELKINIEKNIPQISIDEAENIVNTIKEKYDALINEKQAFEEEEKLYREQLSKIEQFIGLNYNVNSILHFKQIRFRFGRIEKEYYNKFSTYIYEDIDSIFYKCSENKDYVWGVYFVPVSIHEKIDAIYASMHFERYFVPEDYEATPKEASKELQGKIFDTIQKKSNIDAKITELISNNKEDFINAYNKIELYNNNFNVRKYAACTKNTKKRFYIICGWMIKNDAIKLSRELDKDPDAFLVSEADIETLYSKPPTKLINYPLFKPFELLVKMYGMPDYTEFDPTMMTAILYSLLFGFMFGDLGQGLIVFTIGIFLSKVKKTDAGIILSECGICSAFFGIMFGSIFGFEDIIPAIWLRPAKAITNLPVVGNLNTVFIVTIALGMLITLVSMIINIINHIRNRQLKEIIFDQNGFAGIIFYILVCLLIVAIFTNTIINSKIIISIIVISLLLIFFKEPLISLIEKKKKVFGDSVPMFFVQGFFEMVELLLSYFSNTISFVRVGAFALSHAAMMEVVLMLGGYATNHKNWIVIILGNIFVICMEGLIVGIQVLRLQYYEIFSRFYHGTGREFVPYK